MLTLPNVVLLDTYRLDWVLACALFPRQLASCKHAAAWLEPQCDGSIFLHFCVFNKINPAGFYFVKQWNVQNSYVPKKSCTQDIAWDILWQYIIVYPFLLKNSFRERFLMVWRRRSLNRCNEAEILISLTSAASLFQPSLSCSSNF